MTRLYTIGHGTSTASEFEHRCRVAGVELVVDVRSAPGSRRHPHFNRSEMERWLPAAGIAYVWESPLGGFRRPRPDSPNVGLRHPAFRGYADHMQTDEFRDALDTVLARAADMPTAVMCSETLWWRCHRRLLADAAVLLHDSDVQHIDARGPTEPHQLTAIARRAGDVLVYAP